MSKIPRRQQHLRRDLIQDIEHQITQGNAVSGAELLDAIEHSVGRKLDDRLRTIVGKSGIPEVKRRGRPHNSAAKLDFALEELHRLYPAYLQEEQDRDGKARGGDATPSERAYRRLLEDMKDAFGPIDWKALANVHSAWKHGRLHSTENDVDSQDFDAEIDRQFPSRKS